MPFFPPNQEIMNVLLGENDFLFVSEMIDRC